MNTTTNDGVEPPYNTNSGKPEGGDAYIFVIGFFCIVFILMSLTYTSYLCKRTRPPTRPSITFRTTTFEDLDDHHLIRFSCGLDDDVLVTFPTFLYSDATVSHKRDTATTNSSCSICLADYKLADVVRLLPACGHLFHVSCIDTWLKAHPTCPVCRDMPRYEPDGVMGSAEFD